MGFFAVGFFEPPSSVFLDDIFLCYAIVADHGTLATTHYSCNHALSEICSNVMGEAEDCQVESCGRRESQEERRKKNEYHSDMFSQVAHATRSEQGRDVFPHRNKGPLDFWWDHGSRVSDVDG